MDIGEVEEAERRDGNVELGWIDPVAEHAGATPALEQVVDETEERRMQLAHTGRPTQVFRAVEVFPDEKRDKLGMFGAVADAEFDQPTHPFARRQSMDVELPFLAANVGIGLLENRKPKRFLVPEVMIKHALAHACPVGDLVDPGSGETLGGKLRCCRAQDAAATAE